MLNLKKMKLTLFLSVFLIAGVTFANDTKAISAVDILTLKTDKPETKNNFTDALLGCTRTHDACSRLAGQYGYPYYYAEVDYQLCYTDYPYACYGVN